MRIFLRNVTADRLSSFYEVDCDLFFFVRERTIFFNEAFGASPVVKEAKELSFRTKKPVLLHAELNLEGERYVSTLVFDAGVLIGVADSISESERSAGNALRLYFISGKKMGVTAGKDVLFSGVDNVFLGGAEGMLHATKEKFGKEYYAAIKSHERLTGETYVNLFSDAVVFAKDGKVSVLPIPTTLDVDFFRVGGKKGKAFLRLSEE